MYDGCQEPVTTTTTFQFDLDGGRACLDFANTLSASSGDHLTTYADLVAFAEQSKLITRDDADWLRFEAKQEPDAAEGVVVRAKRLRQSIFSMFAAIADGKAAPERDLDALNFDLAASLSHARVLPDVGGPGYHWGWIGHNLDAPLWPISR